MQFTILGLLGALAVLYIVIASAGYKMRKTVGGILSICYIVFATFAILADLNIIFDDGC